MKNFHQDKYNVAFFGIGNMGGPMAINMTKNGTKVKAYDLMPELVEKIKKSGVEGHPNIDSTLEDADVVISMLPNDKAVLDLYLGESGILEKCSKKGPTVFIDCSTVSPQTVETIHERAKQKKHLLIDAPVSGGVDGAINGTLTFICGGRTQEIEIVTPILKNMGQNILHAGPTSSGQKVKLLNNTMLAISMIGTSELINMGEALGLNISTLSEIMKKSSGNSWVLEKYNPYPDVMPNTPASHDYAGGFGSKLMLKDLTLAMEMMKEHQGGLSNPMGTVAKEFYEKHCQKEDKRSLLDFSSIIKTLKK